jgi:CHRD domain/PEP-CTERM motif
MSLIGKTVLTIGALIAVTAPAYAATTFTSTLSGLSEIPAPNNSAGTGVATAAFFNANNSIRLTGSFQNLTGLSLLGHLHCCSTPSATGAQAIDFSENPGFQLGVRSGSFDLIYDLLDATTYTAAFLAASGGTAVGARDRLFGNLNNNLGYFNIHSTVFRGGELRGQLAGIPEPASWGMMIIGFGLAGGAIRRRKSANVKVSFG